MPQNKKCQHAAWPAHKKICKLNPETQAILESHGQSDVQHLEVLRDFTRKHRSTISEAAIEAVRRYYLPPLSSDPLVTSTERGDVLIINVRTRPSPDRARPETRFYVVSAQLESFQSFFPEDRIREMRERLRTCREDASAHRGRSGVVLVVMSCVDPGVELMNVVPIAFELDQSDVEELRVPWKQFLTVMLNEGIVQ